MGGKLIKSIQELKTSSKFISTLNFNVERDPHYAHKKNNFVNRLFAGTEVLNSRCVPQTNMLPIYGGRNEYAALLLLCGIIMLDRSRRRNLEKGVSKSMNWKNRYEILKGDDKRLERLCLPSKI